MNQKYRIVYMTKMTKDMWREHTLVVDDDMLDATMYDLTRDICHRRIILRSISFENEIDNS